MWISPILNINLSYCNEIIIQGFLEMLSFINDSQAWFIHQLTSLFPTPTFKNSMAGCLNIALRLTRVMHYAFVNLYLLTSLMWVLYINGSPLAFHSKSFDPLRLSGASINFRFWFITFCPLLYLLFCDLTIILLVSYYLDFFLCITVLIIIY